MREVYLDNAATTKVRPEIAEAMAKAMVENYGNPSSIYKAAQRALPRQKYRYAGRIKAYLLGTDFSGRTAQRYAGLRAVEGLP